ncbi:MAG: proprotein convertase P-domain-containing protein [Phycisphaerae bacterium]|nr:proprotein convertase P-domain-containing protein [Phycisphaerae bacterium]
MKTYVGLPVVVAAVLSILSRAALGGGTSVVYIYGGGFDQRIPADPVATKGWMQDAVVIVPDHIIICDVDVFVSIRHTAAFDLQLLVRGPDGTCLTLAVSDPFAGYYEGEDYIATTFDDEADAAIEEGEPPFAGSYRPIETLAAFDGLDAYGQWSFRVHDAYYNDTGCLDCFKVIITATSPESPVEVPAPAAGGLVLLGLALLLRPIGNRGRMPVRAWPRPRS